MGQAKKAIARLEHTAKICNAGQKIFMKNFGKNQMVVISHFSTSKSEKIKVRFPVKARSIYEKCYRKTVYRSRVELFWENVAIFPV